MKPRRLEFSGINSFAKPAVIDFDKLLSGGIFGIFGDTGSGKTTILDSMIFALYGRVDRARGGIGSEIINYHCDKAVSVFDFETEWKGKRRVFRVEREIRRKNSAQALRLYELDGDRIVAVSEGVKNTNALIQEIVGLSFDDFKKCIALPQGEFAQFVKADKSDRLQLISRLFGLEKYGVQLSERLRGRYAEAKSAYDVKNGELSGYSDITAESVAKRREDTEEQRKARAKLEETYDCLKAAFEKIRSAYERSVRYAALEREQAQLMAQKEETDGVRAALARLPSAAEIVRLQKRAAARGRELDEAKQRQADSLRAHEKAQAALRALTEENAEASIGEKLEACSARLSKLEYAAADLLSIEQTERELSDLREQESSASETRADAERALALNTEREEHAKERLAECGEESLEVFLQKNFDGALLSAEYRRAFEYLKQKKAELHCDFADGPLFRRVDAEIEAASNYLSERLDAEKSDDVQALLQQYRERARIREGLVGSMHEAALAKERAKAALDDLLLRSKVVHERIEESSARLRTLREKVAAVIGEAADVPLLRRMLRKEQADLTAARNEVRARAESLRGEILRTEAEAGKAEVLAAQLRKTDEEEVAKVRALLAEAKFSNEREAAALLSDFPNAEALRKRVEEYDRALLSVQAKLRMIEEGGAIEAVDEQTYRDTERSFRACGEEKQRAAEQLAVAERVLKDAEARLSKKAELAAELSRAKEQLDLVEKLRELVRGNNFMEFVASEYLGDISAQATETLLRLTGGRYFIRYDQGFFVGDNLCGGELRGVNTLSGGETFLVSLSLALALSAAIYAKSLKPIEFFFLDEGFGTLDEKLVDVVVDSLETLKNNHFSIGLISHVEELKHRIEHKIIVHGAAENGSSEIQINL